MITRFYLPLLSTNGKHPKFGCHVTSLCQGLRRSAGSGGEDPENQVVFSEVLRLFRKPFLQIRLDYNPGKNYVDNKLYKLLQSYFLLTHAAPPPPSLPPFNVVSNKMSFDNNFTQLSSWSTLDRGEWGQTQ